MNVSILKKDQFQSSLWAGGSTTQLFISPNGASYSERNFDVRLSIAKVETEKSTFTELAGVNRKLMLLEGEIFIKHQNHHSKQLKPFDVDIFKGDWTTTAEGACTDFNVMTTGDRQSELIGLILAAGSKTYIELEAHWHTLYIYVIIGNLQIEINQTNYAISQEELLIVNDINKFSALIHSNNNSKIALVKVT